jgi:cell division protein ZapA
LEEKQKIKISIANRVYPLTVKVAEEEKIRKAALRIETILKSFESRYAVQDKQDLIAMCALQLASECELLKTQTAGPGPELLDQLVRLNQQLDQALQD